MKKKYNSEKENYDKNEDERTIDSDNNMLLITNITKCPKCHCLFGKSSKILQHKNHNKNLINN